MSEKDQYDLSAFIDPEFFPSLPQRLVNSEVFMGSANLLSGDGEISTVPPLAGIEPMPGQPQLSVQNVVTDLMGLRAEMPFIPISIWPQSIATIYLPTAGTAVDLPVPDGAVLGKFSSDQNYYVSAQGKAQLPAAGMDPAAAGIFRPEWTWIYLGGITQFSAVSPVAGAMVQLVCISPKVWPRSKE